MRDTHIADDVSTGKHQLQVGAPSILRVQPRWLADRLDAHHERGAVQDVDHLVMPCTHFIGYHHSTGEEMPDVVTNGVCSVTQGAVVRQCRYTFDGG